jgi:hypothetical protein
MEEEIRYCTKCEQPRSLDDFSFKYKSRGIRQKRCKFCMSAISKAHYKNNKHTYIARAKTRTDLVIEENREQLFVYLSSHPCVDCDNTDIRVLEFDHVRGKKLGNISRMIGEGFSWKTIEAEIAKCEVRCANCHRIKTYERDKSWRFERAI